MSEDRWFSTIMVVALLLAVAFAVTVIWAVVTLVFHVVAS